MENLFIAFSNKGCPYPGSSKVISVSSKTSNIVLTGPVLKTKQKYIVCGNFTGVWFYDSDNKKTLNEGQSIFS